MRKSSNLVNALLKCSNFALSIGGTGVRRYGGTRIPQAEKSPKRARATKRRNISRTLGLARGCPPHPRTLETLTIKNLSIMPVLVKVKQNKIPKSKANGKWYGHVVTTKTMTYQELCKHMSEHNSIYGEDVCLGIANKLQNCILEQLLEGKKVQFGELGTFYLSVKSAGAEKEKDFNLGTSIHGLYLCFSPSRTDVNNLSSKMLKKRASFMNVKDLGGSLTPNPSPTGEENQGGGGNSNPSPAPSTGGGDNGGDQPDMD